MYNHTKYYLTILALQALVSSFLVLEGHLRLSRSHIVLVQGVQDLELAIASICTLDIHIFQDEGKNYLRRW